MDKRPTLFGFCGGFQGFPAHQRCPKIIRNGDMSWTCECPCHEESK